MGNKTKYKKLDELVSLSMEGDKKSFEKLCKMEAPQIIYSCTKLMGNTLDGEDAAQEVFISMQRRLPTLKAPEAFVSWIQKMIYYVCMNMRQKNMNGVSTLPIEEFADLFSETDGNFLPEEYIHKKEKSKELIEVIDNLPDQIRACILMHYFSEMKISEIADTLEISEGSVKGYMYVGREKIRKALNQSNQPTRLHSSALLPMVALSQLFRQEMQELITPKMVRHCLSSAGITNGNFSNWLASSAIKDVAIAAACTITVAGTLAVYSLVVSRPPSAPKMHPDDPQSSFAQSSSDIDTQSSSGIVSSAPSASASQPTVQSGSSGDTSAPESTSEPEEWESDSSSQPFLPVMPPLVRPLPNAVATAVSGSLAVKNTDSINNLSSLFDKQYYAIIEQNGTQFALAMVDSKGQFSFDNLSIVEGGIYALQIKNIYSHSLIFSTENPTGTVQIKLVPGQAFKLAQPLWVVDDDAPVVAMSILDKDGNRNSINPDTIQIDAHDTTKITIDWKIQANASGKVVKQGNSKEVDSNILNELQEGYYVILIHVSDALGNETAVSGMFYTSKS